MVRFVDDHTVFVNDYSGIDEAFAVRLLNVLSRQRLVIEVLPYYHDGQALNGIPSAVGCHINSLRTERVVIVPAFGGTTDIVAVKKLESAFPRIPIVPLNCAGLAKEEGKTILYSGDLRNHGRKPGMMRDLLDRVKMKQVDVLIVEGTHFGTDREQGISEFDLEDRIVELVSTAPALVLATFSALDIDRIGPFTRELRELDERSWLTPTRLSSSTLPASNSCPG